MTDMMRRPVSQLRAGDLIRLDEGGPVFAVCAISQPVGPSRRAELVDAGTGLPAPWVRLGLYDAVLTHPERAQWIVTEDAADDAMLGSVALLPADREVRDAWPVEIDLFSRPGWEQATGDELVAAAVPDEAEREVSRAA